MIDPCSEATFVSEALAQRLRLPRDPVFVPVSGIGGARCQTSRHQTTITIQPRFDASRRWEINALILSHLSDYAPPRCALAHLDFASDLQLADDQLDSMDNVEIIIGADLYPSLIEPGVRKCEEFQLVAQATALGWIVTGVTLPQAGDMTAPNVTAYRISLDRELHGLLERFWLQEEVNVNSKALTKEEEECEAHFAATHRCDAQGRFVLRLSFRSGVRRLGDSTIPARSAFRRMEGRLAHQPQLRELYEEFMQEYISMDHMSESRSLPEAETMHTGFFLPHHGVLKIKDGNPKLRVVFNGSIKLDQGSTLNECLHVGPKLQNDIFEILLRWRRHRYVFSADIAKMFRQILIDERDRRYQQIFWRSRKEDEMRAFSLNTVTYGLASSPFQAIRVLHQLAEDEAARYPLAASILVDSSYVDDILTGADSLEEAKSLQQELISLLMAGGFPLSKWTANDPALLAGFAPEQKAASPKNDWTKEEACSMLGISWQPAEDAFRWSIDALPEAGVVTKRGALSFIGRLYDPLGWISPIVIRFKMFMQRLWPLGLSWDDILPASLQELWQSLIGDLRRLPELHFRRWIGLSPSANAIVEIHGFADASQVAYGTVVYLRVISNLIDFRCTLLASKTRVAPLKQVSLPRLELCAALMLVSLVKRIASSMSLEDLPIHLWSDSTVTLSWIRGHPAQWKTYVANRVSEIQTTLPGASWHHITGTQNPADLASRGAPVGALCAPSLWMDGPECLSSSCEPWPRHEIAEVPETDLERRAVSVHTTGRIEEDELLLRFSTLTKLLRVTARCLEFVDRIRIKRKRITRPRSSRQEITELTPIQIDSALKRWISYVQGLHFARDIGALRRKADLPRNSLLLRFNPYIDHENLLRIGGRLQNSNLSLDERSPYVLPHNSFLSLLLARDAHSRSLHGGTQMTLSRLRRRFWILRGHQLVKSVIHRCLRCWRFQSTLATQFMGDLPVVRVRQCRPFMHTGLDYAGPIHLKCSRGRGLKTFKGYIAIFICLPTRAVYLDVASGYSAADFLLVYRRFVSRRGICATLYSDCGTNFVGASRELKRLFNQAQPRQRNIAHLLANEGTEWKFNPPGAPHFGGIWEAAVKSTKHHLKRVIGEAVLTFEEFSTLLAQIEVCLNSRPLQPLTDDPSDLTPLTPAHFFLGTSLSTLPEPSTLDVPISRLSRMQLLRNMYEQFWSRWSTEYLQSLQLRPKWQRKDVQIEVGRLCVIRSELMPPCKWLLARIIEVFPGKDGLIRVVRLKTANSVLMRPVAKISVLPLEENYSRKIGEGGRNVRVYCSNVKAVTAECKH
uniref:Integrase catalytic domain-containing protein n=3 Tax=Trichogramma kaykai TaxID=54128 RepID=A0ABD2WTZ1_9HYME